MTKLLQLLKRVVMVVSAIIVTQTFNLSIALAKPGGIIDKVKQKGRAVKEGVKKGVEGVKDTVEAGEDLAETKRHAEQFWNESGPIDLIGRNFNQTLIICVVTLAATLLYFRLKRDKTESPGIWFKQILGYLTGVGAGFGFEFLQSSGKNQELCQQLIAGAFLLLGCGVLVHADKFWVGFKAIGKKQFRYFLKTFELRPTEVPLPAEGVTETPEEEEEDEEAEDEEEAPASDSESSVSASCPNCGQATVAGAKFCMVCAAPLTAAPSAPIASIFCPNCGQKTVADAKFCMACAAPLPR